MSRTPRRGVSDERRLDGIVMEVIILVITGGDGAVGVGSRVWEAVCGSVMPPS